MSSAISQPITPPPIMVSVLGRRGISKMVELSSKNALAVSKGGGKNAWEPVAIIHASKGTSSVPSAVFTVRRCSSAKEASPVSTRTLRIFNKPAIPCTNFWVAARWRACILAQDNLPVKFCASVWAPSSHKAGRRRAVSKRWAASNKDLDGIHPQFKQTPPNLFFSIRVTSAPSAAAFNAAGYPPGPPPITAIFLTITLPPLSAGFVRRN